MSDGIASEEHTECVGAEARKCCDGELSGHFILLYATERPESWAGWEEERSIIANE
jgi:hypothetical protein